MRKGGNKKIGLVTLTIIITHGYTIPNLGGYTLQELRKRIFGHITIDWDGFGFLQMHIHMFSVPQMGHGCILILMGHRTQAHVPKVTLASITIPISIVVGLSCNL